MHVIFVITISGQFYLQTFAICSASLQYGLYRSLYSPSANDLNMNWLALSAKCCPVFTLLILLRPDLLENIKGIQRQINSLFK